MMAEIRRPLSAVERWYWLSDQFSALNVISRVRVHGRLSIDDLRRGLDALQARHPLLRARVAPDAGGDPRGVAGERPRPRRGGGGGGGGQWGG
ncbi:hypothetical protein I5G38_15225, partial [Pseudomonas aeruginosa]|nr:hypothetical protein [Pseudomonas aeruginosa]